MNKYDRLLYILNLLRSRKNLNAVALAKECGVTERSIYRDIIALSEANIPIYYDNGYKLASDSFLPPLNFDFDEYRSLLRAIDSSPLNQSPGQKEIFQRLRAKIDGALADSVLKKSRFTPETTHVDIQASVDQERLELFFDKIEKAAGNCQVVLIEYDSIRGGTAKREVEPYFIVFKVRAFYFVGFCRLRGDFRTFRVDRIQSLELLDERFVRKDGINADSYFDGSWQVYGGELVEVQVRFKGAAARIVSGSQHHPNETVTKEDNESILYRVTTRGIDEIMRWILGFGGEAEVLAPLELRNRLSALGDDLLSKYKS